MLSHVTFGLGHLTVCAVERSPSPNAATTFALPTDNRLKICYTTHEF